MHTASWAARLPGAFGADGALAALGAGVVALLVVATLVAGALVVRARRAGGVSPTLANLWARVTAWWALVAVVFGGVALGREGATLLFLVVSLLAFREYLTLAPTERADHRTLVWSVFLLTPLQYWLVYSRWYGLFAILVPVYAFVFVPTRSVLAGDTTRFLERAGAMHFGLMACIYCVSHLPAILMLDVPGYTGASANAGLLVWLVLVAQLSDVLQYVAGKLFGRHRLAPSVSPNKTVEGLVGGVAGACAVGAALWWATPFPPLAAAGLALVVTLAGAAGGLVMSAIKRDRGVKDFGALIGGHGGVLDRVDSLVFAAPLFFHLVRYLYAVEA